MASTRSSDFCAPLYGTPRSPERSTLGGEIAEIATILGTPLLPWQRHIADVGMEIDPETGDLVYGTIIVKVGRQQGKTTLLLPKLVHRHLRFGYATRTIYTAQTADKAREKWRDNHVERIKGSPLAPLVADVRLRLNFEQLRWSNGSTHSPVTPSVSTGGTGDSVDEGHIDEAWAHQDAGVEAAMSPTMITRPNAQLVITSTAKRDPNGPGNPKFASYFKSKIRAGRAMVAAGVRSDVAYFEWSAPTDADPYDPATWWGCLPSMGYTCDESSIRKQINTLGLEDFTAEMLGWWPDEAALLWQVLKQQPWEDCGDRDYAPTWPIALAVDVSPERGACISAASAALQPGDLNCVEVTGDPVMGLDHRPGTDWVPARVKEIVGNIGPCAVVVPKNGEAASLIKPLTNLGVEVTPMTVSDCAEAYGLMVDAVKHGTLRHPKQPDLTTAASVALKRKLGDRSVWDWASPGDITPITSSSNALWAAWTFGPEAIGSSYDLMQSVH